LLEIKPCVSLLFGTVKKKLEEDVECGVMLMLMLMLDSDPDQCFW
jgi:hypothetical protein